MVKYTRATLQRSRDPTDIYYKRMIDMMYDYDISLRNAILWDFDGFMPYPKKNVILSTEEELDFYLYTNYVPDGGRTFFTGVALGYFPDYGLTDLEEETEQKDAGSTSTT
jgi:hypothetical protein